MSDLIKFEYYELSNNRVGSLNQRISADTYNPTLLARIYFPTENISNVWLTATVGWRTNTSISRVLFKLWRNTSVIASALSGGEAAEVYSEFNLTHVDTIPSSNLEQNVYYLTAEVTSPSDNAVVLGPLTFTAAQIINN